MALTNPFPNMSNSTSTIPKPKTSGFLSGLGGVASIAAPILGNIIGNIGRRKAEREARDYNHPAQQMARLQEAGLNPNLIYGSSPAQAAGTGQAPDYQMKISSQDILNTQTLRQITAQTQNIKAQTNLADMNAAALASRIPGMEADSKFLAETVGDRITKFGYEKDLVGSQARKAFVEAGIVSETKQKQIERIINESELSQLNVTGKKLENRINEFKRDLAEDGMAISDPMILRILGTVLPNLKERLTGKFREIYNKYIGL
jgi:hypothetical protein